jgi:hypothetical protein
MDADFVELLTNGFVWERHVGDDQWGNKTFIPGGTFAARYEDINRTFGGSSQVATEQEDTRKKEVGTIITDVLNFGPGDRITTPWNRVVSVTRVITEYDEVGPHHQVVYVEEGKK